MSFINTHHYLERARLLLSQKRYKDAETQAAIILNENPENAEALQIIGHCRLDNKKFDEAIELFQQCITKEPDNDYVFYLLAFAHYRKRKTDLALSFLEKAIGLFPYNAGYFALLSNIYATQRKYNEALNAADRGLSIDAENIGCLNARSAALFRLNKKDEAYETINEALQKDPEDDFTHANYGWHFLEAGKHKNALVHFQESLRINPNSISAKEGYKAALKSRLPFYRWILQYNLWMNHQSRGMRIAMIFGLWIVVRGVAGFSDSSQPWLRYFSAAIVMLYLMLVIFSWLGNSLGNMFLLTLDYGRLALTGSEKASAVAVALSLLTGVAFLVCGFFFTKTFLYAGFIFCSFAIPFSFLEFPVEPFRGTQRQVMAHIIIIAGLITAALFLVDIHIALFAGIIYLIIFAVFMWSGSIKSI